MPKIYVIVIEEEKLIWKPEAKTKSASFWINLVCYIFYSIAVLKNKNLMNTEYDCFATDMTMNKWKFFLKVEIDLN